MSLRVWLPLTKDLKNQGLDDVTVTNNGAIFNSAGKLGGSYTGRIDVSSSVIPTILNGSEFTVAFWIYINEVPTSSGVVDTYIMACGTSGTRTQFHIAIRQNGAGFAFCFYSDDYTFYNTVTDKVEKWMHVVCAFKNNTQIVYVDGTKVGERVTAGGLNVAANSVLNIYATHERLNDVRIYNHCLSSFEVKQISQGLILHYPLNNNGFGQENLALNTYNLNFPSNKNNLYMYIRGAATRRLRTDGFYEAYCTGNWQGLSFWENQLNLESGDTITYSFYIYTDGTSQSYSFYPMIYNSSGSRDTSTTIPISLDGNNYINSNARSFGSIKTTIPERHYVTFKWNDSVKTIIDNGGSIELSIQVHGGNLTNHWVCIYAPKIEKGSKATPWCPNSADELANNLGLNDNIQYDCSGYCNNGEYYAYDTNGSINYTSDTPKYNVSTHIASANPTQNVASGTRYLYGHCQLTNPTQMSVAFWLKPITGGYGGTTSNGQGYFCTTNYEYGNISVGSDYQDSAMNHRDGSVNMNDSASTTQCRVTFYPTIGEWHHYVYTYDGQEGRGYKDGVKIAVAQFSGAKTLDSFIGVVIGFSKAGGVWRRNDACYSDFRVYATALSAEDVKSLYQNSAYIDNQGNIYGATYEEV